MYTKNQKIIRCKYMKEIFDNCSEKQLKKLRKILVKINVMERRILAEADKANRFIPGVDVHATWDLYHSPSVGLKYEKVAPDGRKGPKKWIVIAPFSVSSLDFYEHNIRGRDIKTVNLTDFPNF